MSVRQEPFSLRQYAINASASSIAVPTESYSRTESDCNHPPKVFLPGVQRRAGRRTRALVGTSGNSGEIAVQGECYDREWAH